MKSNSISLIFGIIISMKEKKSFKASFIDKYLAFKKPKSIYCETSEKNFSKIISGFQKETSKLLKKPNGFEEITYQTRQVFLYNSKPEQNLLFYITGDTYLQNPTNSHFKFIKNIAEQNHLTTIVPIYGRAPEHSFESEFQIIISLYHKLLDENPEKKIYLMGDGAGGAIALGLVYYMEDLNLRKPEKTILFSPWLDATLSNPKISAFEDKDEILAPWGLRKIALLWARDEAIIKNRHISPIYGNAQDLKNVTIICGSEEILLPDINKFTSFLEQKLVDHQTIIYEGMSHGFYLYNIEEARSVLRQVHEILSK